MPSGSEQGFGSRFRDRLALGVTLAGVVGVVFLSALAIWKAKDTPDAARDILSMVLPLVGTWVGTVLVFYFSREHFESASRQVAQITQLTMEQKLQSFLVSDVMRPIWEMEVVRLPDTPASKIVIVDKSRELHAKGRSRLPVLDADDHPKYIIHRSMLDKYVVDRHMAGILQADINELTLENLVADDADLKTMFETSFATVSETATLAEAKKAMQQKGTCQDAFVTQNGTAQEPVLGWLTNVDIAKHARA